ncbi:hypothetical protein FNV43_RR18989 [Rhamnella rubrinervis]|uniref:Uncharacterized protein n=1 Tax=Rhamnella rubrinervis TaxID=2594499 RepID=A0A8K0E669_9ROSA|nr:hypothetical protein FNV43_RR18989 [Rhamnella rubrinervis]
MASGPFLRGDILIRGVESYFGSFSAAQRCPQEWSPSSAGLSQAVNLSVATFLPVGPCPTWRKLLYITFKSTRLASIVRAALKASNGCLLILSVRRSCWSAFEWIAPTPPGEELIYRSSVILGSPQVNEGPLRLLDRGEFFLLSFSAAILEARLALFGHGVLWQVLGNRPLMVLVQKLRSGPPIAFTTSELSFWNLPLLPHSSQEKLFRAITTEPSPGSASETKPEPRNDSSSLQSVLFLAEPPSGPRLGWLDLQLASA